MTTLTTMTTPPLTRLSSTTMTGMAAARSSSRSSPTAAETNTTALIAVDSSRQAVWYQRLQAWALSRERPHYDGLVAGRKLALLSPLTGTVLEIGPGAGGNLPFFRTDVRWIGIE